MQEFRSQSTFIFAGSDRERIEHSLGIVMQTGVNAVFSTWGRSRGFSARLEDVGAEFFAGEASVHRDKLVHELRTRSLPSRRALVEIFRVSAGSGSKQPQPSWAFTRVNI